MGAGFSLWGGQAPAPAAPGLGDLPELCAAAVLLHLDAPEICRVAGLSRAFRGAAAADVVWEAKLPGNYGHLLEFLPEEQQESGGGGRPTGKREIYARLSRPVPFDGGTKEFWIEKSKAGLCVALSSRALVITGIDDRRYWSHIATNESRFGSVAYLKQIWWLEVVGELDFRLPAGQYSLYFRLHLGKPFTRFGYRACGLDHVHGWALKPARFHLQTSDGQSALNHFFPSDPGVWVLYHVGDFVAANSDTPTRVKFSMSQIDCTHTKGGLCVDAAFVFPVGLHLPKKLCHKHDVVKHA